MAAQGQPKLAGAVLFAGMGCALLAMDCPGQGERQDLGGFAGTTVTGHIVAGWMGLWKIFSLCPPASEYPHPLPDRAGAGGHRPKQGLCQRRVPGGGLGLACAALNPGSGTGRLSYTPFLSDYRLVWELGADLRL